MTNQITNPSGSMPEPPSPEEIAEWADGIVYAKLPGGEDVYFDAQAREWRRVGEAD
jgi:hypothetical protein